MRPRITRFMHNNVESYCTDVDRDHCESCYFFGSQSRSQATTIAARLSVVTLLCHGQKSVMLQPTFSEVWWWSKLQRKEVDNIRFHSWLEKADALFTAWPTYYHKISTKGILTLRKHRTVVRSSCSITETGSSEIVMLYISTIRKLPIVICVEPRIMSPKCTFRSRRSRGSCKA